MRVFLSCAVWSFNNENEGMRVIFLYYCLFNLFGLNVFFFLTGGHFVNQIKQAKRSFEKMMNKRENIDHRNNEESEEEQYSIPC